MNTFDKLTKIYQRWLQRNKLNPLISADDLWHDHVNGQLTRYFGDKEQKYFFTDTQIEWLRKYMEVWYRAEAHEYSKKDPYDEEGIFDLWTEYLAEDKRSFNEYFSEEFGFTCDEGITRKQLKFLCETLIRRKK